MRRVEMGDVEGGALEARRNMAARVAHDVNNLLTPLIAYPELIRMQLGENEQIGSLLGAMEKAAQDMLHLTGRLGAFSKGQEHPGECVLGRAVGDVVQAIGVPGKQIAVSLDDALQDLTVPVHVESFSEALRQVVENALDATGDGGVVKISGSIETLRRPVARIGGFLRKGKYAVVTVEDSGGGLAGGDVEQVFEPLYTTRKTEKGRGSGVGICIAEAILADAGGGMDLTDRVGEGVSVKLYIPLQSKESEGVGGTLASVDTDGGDTAAADMGHAEGKRYHGRVLIVDDEAAIVDVFTIMLNEELPGVIIDSASDGASGVTQFEASQPDVVILDLHMPIMDGLTAFKRMLEVSRESGRPMPKVIFCTGYAPPHEFDRLMAAHGAAHEVLYKPVSTSELVRRVAQGVRGA
jgi:CheY-like chemotaxis protein